MTRTPVYRWLTSSSTRAKHLPMLCCLLSFPDQQLFSSLTLPFISSPMKCRAHFLAWATASYLPGVYSQHSISSSSSSSTSATNAGSTEGDRCVSVRYGCACPGLLEIPVYADVYTRGECECHQLVSLQGHRTHATCH